MSFSLSSAFSASLSVLPRHLARCRHRPIPSPATWCLVSSHQPQWCLKPAASRRTHHFKCFAAGREMESMGVPTSVPVKVAHELLQAGHRYLDVRTPEEFSAGHPSGAINIPYMYRTGSGMTKNMKFLEDVAKEFGKDDEIVVGCQSGKRSMMAASDLLSAGFVGVTDVAGGYAAWAQTGLPTEV